jgi:hypothetical protein
MLCATKISCFAEFFVRTKILILNWKTLFSKLASLRSVHDDMSAKPCENCKMIMVNYDDL